MPTGASAPPAAPPPGERAVLVAGATGFLGGRLARAFLERGYRVRASTRRPAALEALARAGVDVVEADLGSPASLASAVAGLPLVVNAAGRVSDWGPREAFLAVNAAGAGALAEACAGAGVQRLLHVSSLTVLGLPRDGRRIDETAPYGTPPRGDFYTESKIAGERLVREAHGRRGLSTTVVRPGAIWGAGDPNVMPRILRLLSRGAMPYVGGGRNVLGLSHVDNLTHGIVLAAEAETAAGELYHLLDGEEITAREALDLLADGLGYRRPRVSLPFGLLLSLAALLEGAARLAGSRSGPPMTRYGVRFVACDARYDGSKAHRELGYEPRLTFRQGVASLAAGRPRVGSAA